MSENQDGHASSLLDRFEELARARNPVTQPSTLDQWVPPRLGRTFRWSIIVVLLALAAGLLGTGWWLTNVSEIKAGERIDEYVAAVTDLEATLPDAAAAIAPLTDPVTSPEAIEAAVAPLRPFAGASAELGRLAAASLPTLPNGLPDQALRDLVPVRDELSLIAARAGSLADRLNKVAELRLGSSGLFVLPVLPTEANSPEIANDVSLALAAMVADSVAILAELPNDPLLTDFSFAADAHLQWLKTWQPGYVAALRRNSTESTTIAVAEVIARTEAIEAELDAVLDGFREWLTAEVTAFEPELARTAALVRSF